MTDARLKDYWINSPEFDDLTDTTWRVFTRGLMWSNQQGTDGLIPTRYLRMLHPDGDKPESFHQMESAGLWARTPEGFQFAHWVKALGQSSAEAVEHNKEMNRVKQQKWRDEQTKKTGKTMPSFSPSIPSGATSDVTSYATGHVGQDKTVTETASYGVSSRELEPETVDQMTGEVSEPDSVAEPARWESYVEDGKRRKRRVA